MRAASALRQSFSHVIIDGVIETTKARRSYKSLNRCSSQKRSRTRIGTSSSKSALREFGKSTRVPVKGRALNEFLT